mgnify:CR=1 FL=1
MAGHVNDSKSTKYEKYRPGSLNPVCVKKVKVKVCVKEIITAK